MRSQRFTKGIRSLKQFQVDSKHFTNLKHFIKWICLHTYVTLWRFTKGSALRLILNTLQISTHFIKMDLGQTHYSYKHRLAFIPVTQHIIRQLQTSFHPRTQISLLPLLKGKCFLARLQLLLPLFNERAETSLLSDRNCHWSNFSVRRFCY